MKICVIGSGLRTPLLLHGLAQSGLPIEEVALYDTDARPARVMAALGSALCEAAKIAVGASETLEDGVAGSSFVVSSIRPGGLKSRAIFERRALEHGFAGQETTGPAGFAMALRTVPAAIEQARVVERVAPRAWIINFTNPAGLVTQAITTHTSAKVVGICDTPAELFTRIARSAGARLGEIDCNYFGLNHLGWVREVIRDGQDILPELLASPERLEGLYPARLFDPELLQSLRMLPTEYLFFYYCRRLARANQLAAGATRGEELVQMNQEVWSALYAELATGNVDRALAAYRSYLNRRNASYLRLEGAAESALQQEDPGWDPFAGETGYHRIAVEAIRALLSPHPLRLVLNVPNNGCIAGLADEDVIEVPCVVTEHGPRPVPVGTLPGSVQGLVAAVKAYERLTIEAAVQRSPDLGVLALAANPIVSDWHAARDFTQAIAADEPEVMRWLREPRRQEGPSRAQASPEHVL